MQDPASLLDELMGKNRNRDGRDVKRHYSDPEICRSFLCGLCPRELFTNTKADVGGCDKIHDPVCLREFEAEKRRRGDDLGYEKFQHMDLVKYVADIDMQIRRQKERLQSDNEDGSISVADDEEVLRLTTQIKELTEKAEALGEEGLVDESQELVKRVDSLRAQKVDAQARAALKRMPGQDQATLVGVTATQKLRVCEVCGALLSILDSDRRLADHFGGKLHMGYAKIRERIEQLQSRKRAAIDPADVERETKRRRETSPPRPIRETPVGGGGGGGDNWRADRDKRHSRDYRDRERGRGDRDHHDDRGGEYDRRRGGDRDRDRGRGGDRGGRRDHYR